MMVMIHRLRGRTPAVWLYGKVGGVPQSDILTTTSERGCFMRRILLLLAATVALVLLLASTALAQAYGGGGGAPMPTTGGPALLPIGAAAVAASLGVSAGIAHLRRRRH